MTLSSIYEIGIIRALIVLFGCLSVITCGKQTSLMNRIVEQNELRVAVLLSPSRFVEFQDEPYKNIDQQHLYDFANYLGVSLTVIEASSYENLHEMLDKGTVQIASGSALIDQSISDEILYSPPYHNVDYVLVARRNQTNSFNNQNLGDLSMVIPSGSITSHLISDLHINEIKTHEVYTSSPYKLLDLVSSQKADLTIITKNDYELLKYSFPSTKIISELSDRTPLAWALKEGTDHSLYDQVESFFSYYDFPEQEVNFHQPYLDKLNYFDLRAFHSHYELRLPDYLPAFQEAAREHSIDWELLAAMAYQESKWDQDAVSFTGVRGLMMLTSDTADFVAVSNLNDPNESIIGGARYFQELDAKLPARITGQDRTWFIVAAYNLGFGHLEDARILTQIQGGNPDSWAAVEARLSLLESPEWEDYRKKGYARGSEALNYVTNVQSYYELLKLMSFNKHFANL